MKKEVNAIILIGVLLISLTGCNDKSEDNNKTKEIKPATVQVSKKPESTLKDTTKISTVQAEQTTKPVAQIEASEYFSENPVISVESIHISPKHVYYKDSVLYMDAYVYNGFNHNVFNINNIGIKLSNKSGLIAEANFEGLENSVIDLNTYIVWTFVFSQDEIKQQNANLQTLTTEYRCNNSY
jgi:SLAP domain-containing protein